MAGDPCPSLVVCVLGLSREKGEHFSRQRGIGKSCLCYRFMHPGHDDYTDEHSSLLALHEFENPVINSVHFLYWGSTTKRYRIHGDPKEQRIQFHVIEQTVFYQDVTSQPFKILTKPDSLEYYIHRATSHIESPGKISYKSRDTISLSQEYVWQPYPSGISGLPRGFIVVIDVSQNGADFNRQIARAERIMEYLLKHKRRFVIVATKRDIFNPASMNTVQYLKKKYDTQVFAASASVNINVSDAFHFIAFRVLRKEVRGVPGYIPTYEQARHRLLDQKATSRQIFRNFLKKRVVDSDERVDALENMEEYKVCAHVVGKYETDMLFADHLIEVYSKKMKSFAVVQENPQLLLEFLEDFVDQRMDLALYSERLRRWIRSSFEEHPVVSSEEEGSLGMKRSEVASVSPIAKEVNQGHHVLHNTSNSFYPDSDNSQDYVNYPLPSTEKPDTIASYEGAQVGSEMQGTDRTLQDYTSPTPHSKLPQVGPESTVLSADEQEVQVGVREDMGDMDKEEGSSNREVFVKKLSAHLGGALLSLTKEASPSSFKECSHVGMSTKRSYLEPVIQNSDKVGKEEKPIMAPGNSDIKGRVKHLRKLLSREEVDSEPTVVASLNKSSPPATTLTKEAPHPSLKKHSHVDMSFKPSAQLVKQESDIIGKTEKPVTPPGGSDIKRRAEHLKKLLSGEEVDSESTVADASLNTSSPPVTSLTKEAPHPSLKKHSHVDMSFKPSVQLVKQDSDIVGKTEKPITPPGGSDIKRRAEHLKKLLSGEEVDSEPTVADALVNTSSLPVTSLTKEVFLPSLKKHSHFDTTFKSSFAQLVKQDSDNVDKEEKPIMPPGCSDTKRCAEHPKKLVCGEEEELQPSVAEVPLNKSSRTQRTDGKQKQSPKISRPGTRKPVRPAPMPPASPKFAKSDSLEKCPVKPASPSRLQGKQINKPQFSQLHQLPPSPLQLPPSPLQPPPITCPQATYQTPKQRPVIPVNGTIPEKEMYVPKLPDIKRRIEKKRLEEQQKVKDESSIPGSPNIPGTSLSPDISHPPHPSRHQVPPYCVPNGSLSSSHPSHVLLPPNQMESSSPTFPPPNQMVLPSCLPQKQMDPSLPPPPPKRVESIRRLTVSHEQAFSSGDDCQPPILHRTSDTLGDGGSSEQHSICPQLTSKHLLSESIKDSLPLTSKVESRRNEGRPCTTTAMLKPSYSVNMKERPLPAEPFTVDSEDDESDHSYEHMELGSLLAEDGNLSTFATHHRFVPLGIMGDKSYTNVQSSEQCFPCSHGGHPSLAQAFAGKEEKLVMPSGGSDIKICTERPKRLLSGEEEELEPFTTETSLKMFSPTATQYSKQKQSLKTSQTGTRKPARPAPKPPVSQKSAKDDSLEKSLMKLVPPSRLQGDKVHKAQQPQLPQCSPSPLQLSPITSPPPENCLHEQPKEKEEPFVAKSPKLPSTTISPEHSLPTRPLRYTAPSYPAPPPPIDAELLHLSFPPVTPPPRDTEPLRCSPIPPPPEQMKVLPPSPVPPLPPLDSDKLLDYLPMSSTVDDSYENWGNVGSIDNSAVGSPRSNKPPTVPTMSNSSRFSFDDLTDYVNLPVPDKLLDYVPMSSDSDVKVGTVGSTDSHFSASGSPRLIQLPPVSTKRFSFDDYVNLPVPDKPHDMSCTVDDSYVNWETISSIPAQLSAGESPQPSQRPSIPTNSKLHRFSSDDLTDYVNLPTPDKLLVLPPRTLERQQQLTLENVEESSPRPIPSCRMPQSTGETSAPVSSKGPIPRPRTRAQKTSVLELNPLVTPHTSCAPEELLGSTAAHTSRYNLSPHPGHTGLTNHSDQTDISSSLPPQSSLHPVRHLHSKEQVERRLVESAFSSDGLVAAQEVKSMGIISGTERSSSWQRSNKVLYEKQWDLEQ